MITTPPSDRGPRDLVPRPLGFDEPDHSCQCCGRRTFIDQAHCPRCGGRSPVRRQATAPVNLSELADQIAHDLND